MWLNVLIKKLTIMHGGQHVWSHHLGPGAAELHSKSHASLGHVMRTNKPLRYWCQMSWMYIWWVSEYLNDGQSIVFRWRESIEHKWQRSHSPLSYISYWQLIPPSSLDVKLCVSTALHIISINCQEKVKQAMDTCRTQGRVYLYFYSNVRNMPGQADTVPFDS